MMVLGTVILGGGAAALLFLAWRIYWAPSQDPEEEAVRPEAAEGEDKEPEDPEV